MARRIITLLLACVLALAALTACTTTTAVSTSAGGDTLTVQTTSPSTDTTGTTTSIAGSATAATVLAENSAPYAADASVADSANAAQITLQGSAITVESASVTVDGSVATITAAGTYQISGSLDDGQIVVDTSDEAPVYLILSGASISSSTSAPIYVKQAEAAEIILADGTANFLTDGATYVYPSADQDEPNAALFSDDTLVISGTGSLTVEANYNGGIASKNGLTIESGAITVTAADDGIRGKDYLLIEDGTITVNAGGDGLVSDNAEEATQGYISIAGGVLNLTAGGDGIQAETDLVATAGDVTVVAGGGSGATLSEDLSAKGLKAGAALSIDGGSFTINAAEDALHTDGDLTVNGGTFSITAGDDGMHGETSLTVNGGDIQVTESYEGIESANITLNAGTVSIVASDDGVNAAGGDGTANAGGPGGGAMGGGNFTLNINGGTLIVDSTGDGVDVNGTIMMTDGLLIVNGPTEQMNGALDYDGGFTVSGGTVVAVGSAGMVQAPDTSSSQNALLLYFDAAQAAGTLVHIADSAGNTVLTFAPSKAYQSLAFSSAAFVSGETYQVSLGGSVAGSSEGGLSSDGSYTGGTAYTSFTVESVVTQVGSGGRFR
ncbi:MAG: carbohydrate-binding domain-containing protein [Chloroflexales bacterium]|nr:carbohydrate-binding domain-containing protein [Chloroflexales bacterium]